MEQLGWITKSTKKDCMSAFDLRDTEDLSPYTNSSFCKNPTHLETDMK